MFSKIHDLKMYFTSLLDCCFSLTRLKTKHTERHIHPEINTKTHTHRQTDTGIHIDTDPQIQTHRYPHSYTQRHRHTDRYIHTAERQTVTQANIGTHVQI